jgi:hypothetical protein
MVFCFALVRRVMGWLGWIVWPVWINILLLHSLFPLGNCSFDDQNYAVDASLDPLPDVHAATLADCKVLCDNYQDGLIECWAIKYQSSAEKCFMYVSVNPTNYFSTNTNNNPNLFYSTRGCFTCKYTKLENFYFWQFMTLMYIKELSFFKHYCVLIIFYHYKWNGKQTPHSRNS